MATTPPPPGRLRTPPTPLHGARYDDFEPYSPPRRSRRVQEKHQEFQSPPPARNTGKQRFAIEPVSTPRKAPLSRQQSSQTLSPPSSPEQSFRSVQVEAQTIAHTTTQLDGADDASTMFPTPRKTPRKHVGDRALHLRAQAPHELLPTPHKRRIRNTLDSPQDSPPTIPIHVDARERVPEMQDTEDNPFVGPRQTQERRIKHVNYPGDAGILRAAAKNEGLVYMFRGRKMLQRYTDEDGNVPPEIERHRMESQTSRARHAAGMSAQRPLTRSNLKPRRLFASTNHEDVQEESHTADEEAVTDIEDNSVPGAETEVQTAQITIDPTASSTSEFTPTTGYGLRKKKPSPFDSWPRKKAGADAPRAVKRGAEEIEEPAVVGKRTRSGALMK